MNCEKIINYEIMNYEKIMTPKLPVTVYPNLFITATFQTNILIC